MAPSGLLQADGCLTEDAIRVLHLVSGVPEHLLHVCRVRPADSNWTRAPWYAYHRGGGLTIGRTIWLTRKFFDPQGWGNQEAGSLLHWLAILAHEVGHLPQAEAIGRSRWARIRYVALFTWAYASRAALLRFPVHDGARLEQEADRGRVVLLRLLTSPAEQDPLLMAFARQDRPRIEAWCAAHSAQALDARARYDAARS